MKVFHPSRHQFLLTQIHFQGFTTAMMTYYKRVFHNCFKNRENVLLKMRRFLRSCSYSRRRSILSWGLFGVSSLSEISSVWKGVFRSQIELLEYWKGNNTLRNQLREDIGFKSPVFGGEFYLFLTHIFSCLVGILKLF